MDATSGPVLTIRGIEKSYAAPVLRGLDLDLFPGEVHALMGSNGAGKSTLARVVCGLARADAGSMVLAGRPYRPAGRAAAEARGIGLVPQEPDLLGTLSVAENLFLGRWPARAGWIRSGTLRRAAAEALARVGLGAIDPSTPAERLGVGQKQLVAIAATLAHPCRVLILDEPTAALTGPQADRLFRHVARLRAEGVAIVYISHRLDELRRIADRISVLRDGRLVATRPAAGLDLDDAVRLMVGGDPPDRSPRRGVERGPVALRVEGLRRGDRVRDVSFEVHRGEVLGLAGLVGAGRTETLRAVFGADRAEAGRVLVGDAPRPRRFRHPREAVRAGIGMVAEDRKTEGLLLPLSSAVNLTLARLERFRRRLGRIDLAAERSAATDLARRLRLRARSVDQPTAELSGGNQQKVVLGRWLLREPDVLLLDEPTRGVDVAAKRAIHALIDDLARRGRAIVLVSSDLEELLALSDRVAVLSAGRLVATFDRGAWTHEAILAAAFREHAGGRGDPA